MRIINQLTLRYLQDNKKRTILTILCIAISVVMISCVGIAFYSGKQYYKDYTEKTTGDYHYAFVAHGEKVLDLIENDKDIKEYSLSSTTAYYYQDKNDYLKNIYLKRGDHQYFQKKDLSQYLTDGRLPQQTNEIVISKNYLENNHLTFQIGDSILLQNNENDQKETFLIVGIMDEYQSHINISHQAISYINIDDYYTVYGIDQDVSKHIFTHGNQLREKIAKLENVKTEDLDFRYHSSYLAIQDIFEDNSQSLFLGVYNMVAIILVVIILISVFIIYQAFNLSTYDRIQYLGMLSSVGATSKQKKRSVYFEGLLLSIIAIPLGMIISFIGLSITFSLINQLEFLQNLGVQIHTQISVFYLTIVIILSLITIFISLYLPARKISKISVIDALKKNDEVKVKSTKLKLGLIGKHFHIYQQMAIKNYKRQGKRSQVIVLSLVISMVAFVSIFSFGQNMMKQSQKAQRYQDYDVSFQMPYDQKEMSIVNDLLKTHEKVDDYYYGMNLTVQAKLDSRYFKHPLDDTYLTPSSHQDFPIIIQGIQLERYKEICELNHVDYQENQALIYNGELEKDDQSYYEDRYDHMDHQFVKDIYFEELDENGVKQTKTLSLFDSICLMTKEKYIYSDSSMITFIVPETYFIKNSEVIPIYLEYKIYSSQHKELTLELNEKGYSAFDYAADNDMSRQFFMIVQVFIYGFVSIMILFTILNIVNMMSASIDNRRKELGMMMSVGMSPHDIQKMIFYESLFYGIKTFIYAVPLSILIEWLLYIQVNGNSYRFMPSFIAYVIAFIVIMAVMLLTFRVGLNQFKKQNIIETLKDDM